MNCRGMAAINTASTSTTDETWAHAAVACAEASDDGLGVVDSQLGGLSQESLKALAKVGVGDHDNFYGNRRRVTLGAAKRGRTQCKLGALMRNRWLISTNRSQRGRKLLRRCHPLMLVYGCSFPLLSGLLSDC